MHFGLPKMSPAKPLSSTASSRYTAKKPTFAERVAAGDTEPTRPAADSKKTSPPAATSAAVGDIDSRTRDMAATTEQILAEIRREREAPVEEFNVFRLLAGVVQILAIGAALWGLFLSDLPQTPLLVAIFLQLMALTLVMAGSSVRSER